VRARRRADPALGGAPTASGHNAGVSEPTRPTAPRTDHDPAAPTLEDRGTARAEPTTFKELWVEGDDGRVRPVDGPHGHDDAAPAPASDGAAARAGGAGDGARWYEVRSFEDFVTAAEGLGVGLTTQTVRGRLPVHQRDSKHPLAHVEHIGMEWLLVVTPTVAFSDDDRQVSTGTFCVLVGSDVVVTVEKGTAGVHDRLRERLTSPSHGRTRGVQHIAGEALFSLVATASDVELALGDAVAEVEKIVFERRAHTDPVLPIYDLKREITEARRALLPITAELPELVSGSARSHVTFDKRLLDRLVSTVERIDRHLDAHDDLLSDMLSVHLSQVSVRQNEDMRKISAWAAILVFPTIVGGIYGMNFDHMPELHWTLGYPMALAIMAVGCTVLYRLFKRAGWM